MHLTTEFRPDGITLFHEDEEVGKIRRVSTKWLVFIFNVPMPVCFSSYQAAEYYALACYIEAMWEKEGNNILQ